MRLPVPHAPGWYPQDGDQSLRYWDGGGWTGRRRPRPTWAPVSTRRLRLAALASSHDRGRPAEGWAVTSRRQRWSRTRVVALMAMGVSLAGAVGATIAYSAGQPFGGQSPPVAILNDPGFATRASSVCQADLGPAPPARRQVAASALRPVVSHLGSVPVEVSDRLAVRAWLSEWRAVTRLAARASTSRRAGAPPVGLKTRLDSQVQRIDDFARVNGMPACVL